MFDWLPRTEPQRTLTIFAAVGLLSVAVILPLSLSGGDDGVREAIEQAEEQASTQTTVRPAPVPGTPPPSRPPAPPPTTTTPPPEPPRRPPRELRIGRTGSDDKVDFTVTSIRKVQRLPGNQRLGKGPLKAPAGGTLVAAEVTFVNRTKQPLDPFCGGNSAALFDEDGRTHETVRNLYEIEGNDVVCGGTGALSGDKATVTLAFELRRGQEPSHLDLWNGKFTPDFDGERTRLRFRF